MSHQTFSYDHTIRKWYRCTPPSLSSLCSADSDSVEYKNWVVYKKCLDNSIDYTQFPFRPSEQMIKNAIKAKQARKRTVMIKHNSCEVTETDTQTDIKKNKS